MRTPDWLVIQRITFWLSFILSLAGVFTITYSGFGIHPIGYVPPYRNLGIVLLLSGIILFIMAYVSNQKYAEKEKIDNYLR